MRTGTGWLFAMLLSATSVPVWAADPIGPAPSGTPDAYVVTRGDTLWGIAKQMLDDPLLWPRLWEENPSIKNPHRIFPGDRIAVPGRTLEPATAPIAQASPPPPVTAPPVPVAPPPPPPAVPPPVSAATPVTAPPVPLVPAHTLACSPILTSEEAAVKTGIGSIVEGRQGSTMLSQEDRLLVSLAAPQTLTAGDRLAVVRPAHQVVNPDTGRAIGRVVLTLGLLGVTHVEGQIVRAKVIYSCGTINLGDQVVPYVGADFPSGRTLEPAQRAVEGLLLGSARMEILVGQYQTVFLSPGVAQGVEPGDVFAVYRIKAPVSSASGAVVPVPPDRLGEAVVIRSTGHGSTALVMQSIQDFRTGDRVVLSQHIAR